MGVQEWPALASGGPPRRFQPLAAPISTKSRRQADTDPISRPAARLKGATAGRLALVSQNPPSPIWCRSQPIRAAPATARRSQRLHLRHVSACRLDPRDRGAKLAGTDDQDVGRERGRSEREALHGRDTKTKPSSVNPTTALPPFRFIRSASFSHQS